MIKIVPIILSGGSGTRLWPMSTPARPKQFIALVGDTTMFEQTVARTSDPERFAPPIIVGNAHHADLIEAQLGDGGGTLILEPCARNTAPAIALAAIEAGFAPMLVMPSDHIILDTPAFIAAVEAALPLVEQGWLVTFGIEPDSPNTGYGYLKIGEGLAPGVHRVEHFIEKPDLAKAEAMLVAGGHAWNGGIFLFRADIYLEALAANAPEMRAASQRAMASATRVGARILPEEAAFASSPSDSIDYAVMEKAERVAVVPVSMGWSDVGSWDALHEIGAADTDGNVIRGDVRLTNAKGNLIETDGIRISATGIEDLIIVASGNEVMILPRGRSQEVKQFSG